MAEEKNGLTYEERMRILSKDVLNVYDIMKLMGLTKGVAYKVMRDIKLKGYDRLGMEGKIHTQDYLDCFHLPQESERYRKVRGMWP